MQSTMMLGALISVVLMTSPLPAIAQGPGERHGEDRGLPPAAIPERQAREADDMALLVGLRPEQRPVLMTFLRSMAPPQSPPPPPRGASDPVRTDGMALQLDRMTRDAARRSVDDTQRIAALRSFYDVLDPAQRRAFDALMRLRHGPGPRGPMHGGDGPPPSMDGMPPHG
jgi:hypothetical protein